MASFIKILIIMQRKNIMIIFYYIIYNTIFVMCIYTYATLESPFRLPLGLVSPCLDQIIPPNDLSDRFTVVFFYRPNIRTLSLEYY